MRKIFISAGHSDTDPGAVANGVREADIAREFRDLVGFYLDKAGVDFIADGQKGVNIPLKEAVKLIPEGGVSVEFHLNAATPAATGVETLSKTKDFKFGNTLCDVVAKRLKIRNRGAKAEDSGQHSKLAFVQGGGLILELFFITNPSDLAAYNAVKWPLAQDIANVLIQEANK